MLVWYGLFLAQKIDLTTADLGRHIQNGNIILHGSATDFFQVLHTNFYSYTNPDFAFVNHHWGSGVIFYLIHQFSGFTGLSIFYILLGAATLWWFFDIARRESNIVLAAALASFLIPLMASRAEVRPEMFTYFFSGLFFWVLWRFEKKQIDGRWLFMLPAFMLLWVNLHIGFFF